MAAPSAEPLPAGDAILILDGSRNVVWSGEYAAVLFGRERDALRGMPLDSLLEGTPAEGEASVHVLSADVLRVATRARVESWQAPEGARFFIVRLAGSAERMASLGRLAATMAHEFNNILAGIGSFADVLSRRATDEDMRRVAGHINRAIRRGKTVTDEILRYTRAKPPLMAVIDVHAWLEAFAPEAAALTGGRATVEPGEQLTIRGDVGQLNQVLVNLLINARDASPSDAPIFVRATTARREDVPALDLAVIDHGTGIPKEIRERLFEPLFTTKRSGTGLGLPIVDQIVRAHNGVVRVRSELGMGSEFHVLIPLYAGAGAARRVPSGILIADDDTTFTGAMGAALEKTQAHIRAVHRAGDVVKAIEQQYPDILVLDIGLPDMRGTELYGTIAERWPDLPVVFISGRRSDDLEPLLLLRHVAFLEKPFAIDDLLAVFRRILA